jgi:hypothetical protein
VELRNGVIVGLSLPDYNLTGTLPSASLARLESLTSLWLQDNDLQGALPPDIGGYGSLPNLKILSVENNEHLGGVISRDFLNTCEECNISGCAPQWAPEPMKTPFLCGASFCSEDIGDIFCHGPKKATERLQDEPPIVFPNGVGTEMNPEFLSFTEHLRPLWQRQSSGSSFDEWLLVNVRSWCTWQRTWLEELRSLTHAHLYVFLTRKFQAKFKSKLYVNGRIGPSGKLLSGAEWCMIQSFDPSYGFSDKGWGFASESRTASVTSTSTLSASILDWERRHIESVSNTKELQVVFIGGAFCEMQIARPSWYPFAGQEAPQNVLSWDRKRSLLVMPSPPQRDSLRKLPMINDTPQEEDLESGGESEEEGLPDVPLGSQRNAEPPR